MCMHAVNDIDHYKCLARGMPVLRKNVHSGLDAGVPAVDLIFSLEYFMRAYVFAYT